jgi:hypothetical protein
MMRAVVTFPNFLKSSPTAWLVDLYAMFRTKIWFETLSLPCAIELWPDLTADSQKQSNSGRYGRFE